jgi:hypothetical protein
MKLFLFLSLYCATNILSADDLSLRVRQEILDQYRPVTVNVSTRGITTLQFPERIEAMDGDGFSQKSDESGEFSFTPGTNWVSLKSLRPGAMQNLNIILGGKAFSIQIVTTGMNDFVVVFKFPSQIAFK